LHQDLPIVILCGGAGARLRPLTQTIPKTLVPLNGKPMLQHILEYHLSKGHNRFILCVGYLGDAVRRFVDQAGLDAEIVFSDMGETASMLKRLHGAVPFMGERALVTYGDTLIDTGLTAMLKAHMSLGSLITLPRRRYATPSGWSAWTPRTGSSLSRKSRCRPSTSASCSSSARCSKACPSTKSKLPTARVWCA